MDSWPTTAMDACNSVSPASPVSQALPAATLHIHPTTGGHFELQVALSESVEALKALVSKRLKVPKERICLLYRERHLREGTLQQNSVFDGCKLTLLPSVETGLLAQRPEQSVMNALESLSDGQVNDFLCGKAPLNLTMRLGDHMMFIQLQLSTVAPTSSSSSTSTNTSTSLPSTSSIPTSPPAVSAAKPKPSAVAISQPTPHTADEAPATNSIPTTLTKPVLDTKALAEASRNLTHTLRQLSNAALSGRGEETEDALTLRRRQGAIIESMHHHGRGVYSGTFSGTLNPALQDCHGRPRRDISTIIHILNDLLGATPHYRRRGNRGRITSPTSTTEHAHKNESEASLTKSQEMRPNSRLIGILPTPTEERQRLTQENRATRGKMEQLQLMLEERRARRRARREARAPYAWPGYSNGSGSGGGSSGQTPAVRDCEDSNNASASDFHPLSTPETVVA